MSHHFNFWTPCIDSLQEKKKEIFKKFQFSKNNNCFFNNKYTKQNKIPHDILSF
jgi:hypothetical protein